MPSAGMVGMPRRHMALVSAALTSKQSKYSGEHTMGHQGLFTCARNRPSQMSRTNRERALASGSRFARVTSRFSCRIVLALPHTLAPWSFAESIWGFSGLPDTAAMSTSAFSSSWTLKHHCTLCPKVVLRRLRSYGRPEKPPRSRSRLTPSSPSSTSRPRATPRMRGPEVDH